MNKSTVLKLILILSLTFLLFSACSDDDDPTGPGADSIVGVWKADKSTIYYGSLTNSDSSDVEILTADISFTLTIKDDNTFTVEFVFLGVTESISGTWSVSGNKITIKESGQPDDTSDYLVSGNTLTITSSETVDGYTTFEVTTFTRQ